MKYACTITRLANGRWSAHHDSREVGAIEVQAASRDEAIAKIEGEIRYRLELCPCTGETYQHIAVQIVDTPAATREPRG